MMIHGVTVKVGDIIARRPGDKNLWWIVLGGNERRIALGYLSPAHMTTQQYGVRIHTTRDLDPLVKVSWK